MTRVQGAMDTLARMHVHYLSARESPRLREIAIVPGVKVPTRHARRQSPS
ncbi:MAG: hypothetical protein H8F28_05200 [Fibrella sp.]|nr:hypothetical protein [Armatimonadota bacterium]